MDRRAFISSITVSLLATPRAAQARQPERMRRVGVLMQYAENDPEGQRRATVFRQGLEKLGWTIGRNLQIDYQWGIGDSDWIRSAAMRLLRLAPDVILANGGAAARAAQEATRTVPIIFIGTADPVADGFVQSLSRPGGNLTGFTVLEPSVGAKLLELLKEIAPRISRVAVMTNPDSPSGPRLHDAVAAAAERTRAPHRPGLRVPVRRHLDGHHSVEYGPAASGATARAGSPLRWVKHLRFSIQPGSCSQREPKRPKATYALDLRGVPGLHGLERPHEAMSCCTPLRRGRLV